MAINDELNETRNSFRDIDSSLQSINASLQTDIAGLMGQLTGPAKVLVKSLGQDLTRAVSISNKSLNEQDKIINKITRGQNASKDIAKEIEKIEQQKQVILRKIEVLERNSVRLTNEQKNNLLNNLDAQLSILGTLQDQNNEMVDSTGLLGRLASDASGLFKSLGSSGESAELLGGALENARASGGGMASVTKNFAKNIAGAIKPTDIFSFLLEKSFEALKKIDTRTADLQRNLGLSKVEAINLNDELAATAISSNTIGVNVDTLTKTVGDLNNALGGTAIIFDSELLESATFLRERLKLSEESLANMTMQSLATGQSLESLKDTQLETLVAAEKEFGMRFNTRQVLDEANKISGALRLNLEKAPGGLVKAVTQAKMLGLNMEQTAKMAGKLLDFESSIEAELEAELLTGRDLNLEQARLLALKGDTAGAAAEIAKQVGSSAEFAQMNVIAQQSLADAAGLTVDELSDALRKQEGIASQAGEAADRTAEQAENAATALSVQERLAGAAEKLAGILEFSAIAVGVFLGALTGFILSGGPLNPAAPLIAIAAGLGGGLAMAAVLGKFSKGDDVMSEGGYGKRTLLAPEGAIKLNDKDTVIAGTNLGGGGGTQAPSPPPSIDLSPLLAKMDQMNTILNQILSKEGTIMLDSTKVGTALNVGSTKMQ
jgi:hypothetical protein